jgi:hypothetical protein
VIGPLESGPEAVPESVVPESGAVDALLLLQPSIVNGNARPRSNRATPVESRLERADGWLGMEELLLSRRGRKRLGEAMS